MRLTEQQLRAIIRETLLLEQPTVGTTDVGAIEKQPGDSWEEEIEIEDPGEITTVGHLAQLMAQARSTKQGETIKSTIKDTVVDDLASEMPGLSSAQSIVDFAKERYDKPDNELTQTALDHIAVGVDDNIAAMLDDNVEKQFVDSWEDEMEKASPDTPLQNFNINAALQKWLSDEFESRTVSGFGEGKVILNKNELRKIILENLS